jgi:hypothetical protein
VRLDLKALGSHGQSPYQRSKALARERAEEARTVAEEMSEPDSNANASIAHDYEELARRAEKRLRDVN